MPVRKFRNVEEMNRPLWRQPGDPQLLRAIRSIWEIAARTSRRTFRPGVYKYASIEEMQSAAVTRSPTDCRDD
jgi:hypothetical protein